MFEGESSNANAIPCGWWHALFYANLEIDLLLMPACYRAFVSSKWKKLYYTKKKHINCIERLRYIAGRLFDLRIMVMHFARQHCRLSIQSYFSWLWQIWYKQACLHFVWKVGVHFLPFFVLFKTKLSLKSCNCALLCCQDHWGCISHKRTMWLI